MLKGYFIREARRVDVDGKPGINAFRQRDLRNMV